MLISLLQKDIEAAVKAHIAGLGISLAGKTVTLTFATTRKGGHGISCEAEISDADMQIPAELVKPALTVVPVAKPVEAKAEAKVEAIAENAAAAEARAEACGSLAPVAEEVVAEAKPAVGSLFS